VFPTIPAANTKKKTVHPEKATGNPESESKRSEINKDIPQMNEDPHMPRNRPSSQGQRKVRCAVVGLGRVGSLLEDDPLREKPCTHAGAIAANTQCILAGGCDLDPERRKLFSKHWGAPAFAALQQMLQELEPDLVCVATPPETHLELVRGLSSAGVRAVVCEKPLAPDPEQAREIAALHRPGRTAILTNHERRYSRDYLRVRDSIRSARYGPLVSAIGRVYMGETRKVGDMLLEDGTHMVDILSWLLGSGLRLEYASVHPAGKGRVLRVLAAGGPRTGSIPVYLEAGSGRDHLVFELELSFTCGMIRIGNGVFEERRSEKSPYYQGYRSLLKTRARRPRVTGYFRNMLQDAVRCVLQGCEPVSPARDGLSAIRFIDEVRRTTGV
jgi:predicted dehydrogenase